MSGTRLPKPGGRDLRHIHCVGVAGMGLGPLAIFLSGLGFTVTGEDEAADGPMIGHLERAGVKIGPLPASAELVVHSSAVPESHPARREAQSRGLVTMRRGELLAEVTRGRQLVAVCGSHGKTTTTAMLVWALRAARVPVGYVLGGLFNDETPPAEAGSSPWLVAEIDESDGTIDRFSPAVSVVVNLDWDHPDYYQEPGDLEAAFARLFSRTQNAVLVSDRCPRSARLVADRVSGTGGTPSFGNWSFGRLGDFSGQVARDDGRLTLELGGRFAIRSAVVRARGEFNGSNAMAALAAAQLMGTKPGEEALADFPGVRRRQAVIGERDGFVAVEDYAHHPTEITALLASLRAGLPPGGRLHVVFQPHRFSRTAQFRDGFAEALTGADSVVLLDVYPAGEAPTEEGRSAGIAEALRNGAPDLKVDFREGDAAGMLARLRDRIGQGDCVAFVGAGDVDRMGRAWFEAQGARGATADWDRLAARLKAGVAEGTRVTREEPLAQKTTLRVGGAARVYAEPATVGDLAAALKLARASGVAVHFLGRGSNLLVPDAGVDGMVLSLAHPSWAEFAPRGDGTVWVGAGLRLKNLCGLATREGLGGFEFLEGIPGSVGGALRMNAGAMGGWMFDVVEEVKLMTPEGEVVTRGKGELHVGYRHCAELENAVALGALLRSGAGAASDGIARQIDVYRRKRHETQPREPSAGCIFKNPEGGSAGRLIDESGLKGTRVGGAEVSAVHANFIVNRGGATSADVIELVRRIRARVREARGVDLEPEVLLYGREWKDVL